MKSQFLFIGLFNPSRKRLFNEKKELENEALKKIAEIDKSTKLNQYKKK